MYLLTITSVFLSTPSARRATPALLSLCVPIANASKAMQEITNGKGPAAVFYRKALAYAAKLDKKQGN
mgnify:CR=1 FL=1